MNQRFKKLEMLRGFAAAYVFGGHLILLKLHSGFRELRFFFSFGQEAVMIFFLLSGFVVFYSTHNHHDQSFHGYFMRRWKRIYPIFLLAMIVAYMCACLSAGIVHVSARELWGNLLMLQDFAYAKPGVFVGTFLGNGPLWSLSYEWWFYMMFFPIYKFIPGSCQIIVVGVLSLIGFGSYFAMPNQVSLFLLYFILWWAGAELARTLLSGQIPGFKNQLPTLLILGLMTVLLGSVVIINVLHHVPMRLGLHPFLEFRHFMACLMLLCFGLFWAKFGWRGFTFIFKMFLPIAPISYALYVLHFPIINSDLFLHLAPGRQMIIYIVLAFSIACFAEFVYQPFFMATLNWFSGWFSGQKKGGNG
jgi:peptidoglycan/LPS O-acetylase OafA/YrhL